MLNLPRRVFLPWNQPLLPQAVRWLVGGWTPPAALDLSRTLVVVPTRESGRRLREALAAHAAQHHAAVFPPRVVTPEGLVTQALAEAPSRLQRILAWIGVLRDLELEQFRHVFPVDPPARTFTWALRLAEQFTRLQTTLGEAGLAMGDVAARAGANFPETERWAQLAELELRQRARLEQAGISWPIVDVASERGRSWLTQFERVVLVGTADPMAAAVALLGAQVDVPVTVVVFAPDALGAAFDAWGRPLVSEWSGGAIDLPDFERRVHLCADPSDEAARLAELAATYADAKPEDRAVASQLAAHGSPVAHERGTEQRRHETTPTGAGPAAGFLAVGIADAEVGALLAGEAARVGVAVYNPEGRRRREGALYQLLEALGDGSTPTFADVETLARCPDFLAYVKTRCGPAFSAARLLDGLDTLRREHLPSDLATARRHASGEVAQALEIIDEIAGTLARMPFPRNLADVVAEIYRDRRLDLTLRSDAALQDAATAWTDVLRECAAAADRLDGFTSSEWRELALRLFGDSRHAEEKPLGALELQGWLELLFEDAPHLVVAGLNDGFVPEAVVEDPFLPDSLRVRLGLKSNAARAARDAYLLQAIAACRAVDGRLDLLFGKTSAAGDPLRPSRLLLRCADDALPERVAFLFRNADPAESHLPWRRAWRLRPRVVPPPPQVAVTALRRWLACPFRFYLQYALKMEAVDATKSEMDAFDFGTLCHAALEAMGRDAAMRDGTDAGAVREFLLAELTRQVTAKFGSELTLPLMIQMESARQRLGRFAEVQARDRAEGWVIQAVEQPFSVEIAGVVVRGKVDRIDRHERNGITRVLDYKTSDAGIAPRAAHLRSLRGDDALPEWAMVDVDGKRRAWADLQLPLYRHALAPTWGASITLGYVTLPKAVGETALAVWDDYTPELHEAAMRCAEGVCGAIARSEFWPPNENIRADNDAFATLFHHGVAESVAWEGQNVES